jgi:glycosyltransferase involved in cell wall biosynthesis
MIVGIDGLPLTVPRTGIGHYTVELARAMARRAPATQFQLVYPSTYSLVPEEALGATLANLKTVRVPVGVLSRHWWSVGLPAYLPQSGIELFHGTNYEIPLRKRCPTVLTIHDVSLLSHSANEQRRRVWRAKRRLPLMARFADAVIFPTKAVRKEVCDLLSLPATKVTAIPEAARDCFYPAASAESRAIRDRLAIGERFLLAVGTIEPRKNFSALVRAFEYALRERPELQLQLVIVGGEGWSSAEVLQTIARSTVRERIVLTGYLGDVELRALYSLCVAFVYPSLYEGFGLPPLEAMACGAPVIASRIPALVETTAGAARLFELGDDQDLAHAIVEMAGDEKVRANFVTQGQKQAARFSWEQSAAATLEVYDEARRNFQQR